MSEAYINRLRWVRDEMDAAGDALTYVIKHWNSAKIIETLAPKSDRLFREALHKLEKTYFIRLTAEFEGVLKDHLRTNHASIKVSDKPQIDWLLSQVVKAEMLRIDPNLRRKLNEVRDYRNSLAHSGLPTIPVSFKEALARYNTFLSKLPEPRK